MIPSLIGLAFGVLWLVGALSVTPAPWNTVIGAVGGVIFLAAIARIVRRGPRAGARFDRRWYIGAVIAEVVAIFFVQAWLVQHHRGDLLLPAVGVIVGLHFIGLWRAIGLTRFLWLTAALVVINLAALLLPLSGSERLMVSGYGSSVALLLSAAL